MAKKLFLLNVIIVVIISRFENSYEECLCNVRLRGEYCGTELNKRNGNSDCLPDHIYFCANNIRGKSPKLLVKCKDEYECEQNQFTFSYRARRRNPCLKRLKCQCPSGIGRGPHCGSKLVGDECPPDMLFICRPRTGLDSRGICPDGCNNGRCNGDTSQRRRNNDSDDDISDDDSDRET